MDRDFEVCMNGNHKWETIQWVSSENNDEVVRWCSVCGAIVVDKEKSGKLIGHVMSIKGPKTFKLYQRTAKVIDNMGNAVKEIGK